MAVNHNFQLYSSYQLWSILKMHHFLVIMVNFWVRGHPLQCLGVTSGLVLSTSRAWGGAHNVKYLTWCSCLQITCSNFWALFPVLLISFFFCVFSIIDCYELTCLLPYAEVLTLCPGLWRVILFGDVYREPNYCEITESEVTQWDGDPLKRVFV